MVAENLISVFARITGRATDLCRARFDAQARFVDQAAQVEEVVIVLAGARPVALGVGVEAGEPGLALIPGDIAVPDEVEVGPGRMESGGLIKETRCEPVVAQRLAVELDLHDDRLFALALELERIALEDDYFIGRKLYPNVDFYSGIVLHALGIPTKLFTALFAMGRTVGWIAHWAEMISDPEHRIGRPRQLYTGPARRDVPAGHRRTR